MPHPSDSYFVRLDVVPTATRPTLVEHSRHAYVRPDEPPVKKRRRRHKRIRPSIVILLLVAVWAGWAYTQPGHIAGTVDRWIAHVQGNVSKISADPDLKKAEQYYNAQYAVNSAYPQLSDDQLATAGIGIGVTVEWCGAQAVVLQGQTGAGSASRLLLYGHSVGTVAGKHDCPQDFNNPAPWTLHN